MMMICSYRIIRVNPKDFKNELDKYDFDEADHGDDDMCEEIESRDMDNQEDVAN